jgi:histidyl-tRNA synthetase
MTIETIKGFSDYTGEEAIKRAKIKSIIEQTFQLYNFEPAETPIIEDRAFVEGDNKSDEAVSDIYKLEDKGKRKLALRYELTFPLKRIMQNKKLPYRRYQIGEVFRDEPISANRTRQFTQCDIDIIGSKIKDEVEVLNAYLEILNKLNIKYLVYFNNRKLLNEILENEKIKQKQEVIKELDKLDKLPEKEIKLNLKRYNAEKLLEIFKKPESYFKKYESYKEIEEFKNSCKLYNIKLNFQANLARGLSYYNGTIFEVKTKEIKETILAGGAYMFNNIQCFGASASIERLSALAKINLENKKVLIISMNQDKKATSTANSLRELKIPTQIYYGKPGKALEYANSYNISYVIFLGEEEIKQNKLKIKDMKTGKEELISELKLKNYLNNLFN